MKALLLTVVRAFEFELAVPVGEIGTNLTAFQKSFLINDPKVGSQMPQAICTCKLTGLVMYSTTLAPHEWAEMKGKVNNNDIISLC